MEKVTPDEILTKVSDNECVLAKGSCWITVGSISVYVVKTDEGVVVDLYPLGCEDAVGLGSIWATFAEAQEEINVINSASIGA